MGKMLSLAQMDTASSKPIKGYKVANCVISLTIPVLNAHRVTLRFAILAM